MDEDDPLLWPPFPGAPWVAAEDDDPATAPPYTPPHPPARLPTYIKPLVPRYNPSANPLNRADRLQRATDILRQIVNSLRATGQLFQDAGAIDQWSLGYLPATPTDWPLFQPETVWQALDELGALARILQSQISAIPPPSSSSTPYTSGTGLTLSSNVFSITNTSVSPSSYTNANITVNAQGQLTAASNGTAGTVTSVGASGPSGILSWSSAVTSSGTLTATLATQTATYVLAGPTTGSAATPTFRALVAGDIPALSYLTSNQTITISGDISGSGTTGITATLPTVNSNVGTFQGITVNGKGIVTAAVNQSYLTSAVTSLANYSGDTTLTISASTGAVTMEINLASANTWTAAATHNIAGIGATSTDGLILENTTAAGAGSQQWSPRLHFIGRGWKTNSTASSEVVDWIAEAQPVQGSTAPTVNLVLSSQVNAAGYTTQVTFTSTGNLNVTSVTLSSGNLTMSNGGQEIVFKSNSNGSLLLTDGTTTMIGFDSRNTSSTLGAGAVSLVGKNVSLASAASAFANPSVYVGTKTLTLTGTTTTTSWHGGSAYFDAVTFTDSSVCTLTAASLIYIAALPAAGGSLTITNSYMIFTGVAGCYLTNSGVWTSIVSSAAYKENIQDAKPDDIMAVIDQIRPRSWKYDAEHFGHDNDRQRFGIVAEEMPEACLIPGQHPRGGINGGILGSLSLAAIKVLRDENQELRKLVQHLTERIVNLEGKN